MCRESSSCLFGHKLRSPLKGWVGDLVSKTPAAQAWIRVQIPALAEEASVAVNICTVVLGSGGRQILGAHWPVGLTKLLNYRFTERHHLRK